MRKYLIATTTVVALALLLFLGRGWLSTSGPDAGVLREALAKAHLPPGYDLFATNGDDLETSFYVRAEYGNATVAGISAFYQSYFDDNGWKDGYPDDEPTEGSFYFLKGRTSMNVTVFDIRGRIHLMVIYTEYEHTHEEFGALVKESAAPEAMEIIAKTTMIYASLTSYRDSGTLETVEDGEPSDHATFTTAYVAPDQLCFEYADTADSFDPHQHVLAMQGDTGQRMSDYDDAPETENDITLAISSLYGVTSTTSGNIPELLLQLDGTTLFHLAHLKVLEEKSLDGVVCLRLHGTDFNGSENTIWVGKEDRLIRKIESVADAKNRERITYTPEANINIPAEDLAFKRPKAR